ncbi:hypothetical protein PtrSN002B_012162, partial [Pyrenophora tritici-repentis]
MASGKDVTWGTRENLEVMFQGVSAGAAAQVTEELARLAEREEREREGAAVRPPPV